MFLTKTLALERALKRSILFIAHHYNIRRDKNDESTI